MTDDSRNVPWWRRRRKPLERTQRLDRGGIKKAAAPKRKTRIHRRAQPTTGCRLWVRATQRCCVPGCGKPGPDPHHVSAKGMGGANAWKVDECNVAPLCRHHHQLGDSPGWSWLRFEVEHHVHLDLVAIDLWWCWRELPQETRERWEQKAYRVNIAQGVPKNRARRAP